MEFCMRIATQEILEKIKNREEHENNFVMSPLSINAMLNMIAMGSTGETLEELLNYLGSETITDLHSKSLAMVALTSTKKVVGDDDQRCSLESSPDPPKECNQSESWDDWGPERVAKEPTFSMVNGIWSDQRFPLKPCYLEIAKTIFQAHAKTVDFVQMAEEARNEVNIWVAKATKGLLKDILQPGSFDSQTMVVLANALYFKGDWLDPFDAYYTRDRDFHLLNGKTVRVPLMAKGYTVNFYGSFDDFKLLKLPYDHVQGNKQLSMYVFLPHKKDGLQDLMVKFDSDPSLLTKQYDLRREELEVILIPKFKFSYAFTASNSMIKLGLTLPFCPKGELTEMVDSPHSDKVFISRLFHKSLIEVDEEGTEAASVTISPGFGSAMRKPKPRPSFVADHPFMFMIKDDTSGVVFFTGALLNPK